MNRSAKPYSPSARAAGRKVGIVAVAKRCALAQERRTPVDRGALRARVVGFVQTVEEEYRRADLGNRDDPIQELVYIALTRQAHPKNAHHSLQTILDAGGLAALLAMSEWQLQRLLAPGGLSRQKAKWTKASLSSVVRRFGELSLEPLGSGRMTRLRHFYGRFQASARSPRSAS